MNTDDENSKAVLVLDFTASFGSAHTFGTPPNFCSAGENSEENLHGVQKAEPKRGTNNLLDVFIQRPFTTEPSDSAAT